MEVTGLVTLLGAVNNFAEKYLKKLIDYYQTSGRHGAEREELKRWLYENGWKQELIDFLSSIEFDCEKADKLLNEVVEGEVLLGREVLEIRAKLSREGVIGVGSGVLQSVFEIGLGWDYILDLPIIPGSSVKGAVRSLVLNLCASLSNNEAKCRCLKLTTQLFGWVENPLRTPEARELEMLGFSKDCMVGSWGMGLVVFHDAYPVPRSGRKKCELLEPWVITPHYKGDVEDEYSVQPVPIPHVVLRKETTFRFVISYESSAKRIPKELAELLKEELQVKVTDPSILLSHLISVTLMSGVGARTSKGFTSFDVETIIRYRGG